MGKKIVIIPDVHGKKYWEEICENNVNDSHIVFLGDYFDGVGTDSLDEELNFNNIIGFKKKNPDNVTLLLGNHCLHYIYGRNSYPCSRYNPEYGLQWGYLYQTNKDLFDVAYQYKDHLFTHAGISKKWFKFVESYLTDVYGLKGDLSNLGDVLNNVNKSDEHRSNLHSVGGPRGGSEVGGITWADAQETLEGIIPNLHQFVGHSRVKQVAYTSKIMGTTYTDRSITYTDCWDYKKEYLILTIGDDGQTKREIINF